ncbi:MAG: amino acid ABC transporter permease [Deltaproteobacteria bacterium]|nr:amino acid ABC transporter permease [Deltaproteobacteria bacterium]
MTPKKLRFTTLDGLLVALFLGVAGFFVYRIGVEMQYRWQWPLLLQYLVRTDGDHWLAGPLARGFLTTVKLSLWAMFLATLLGTLMGLLRVSRGLFRRLVPFGYVELVRNLPPLVLVFIVYFFIGERIMALLGVEQLVRTASPEVQGLLGFLFAPPARLSGFLAGLATLVLYEGAYIAEIVRAGIQSIEKGQWEAAHALGLSYRQQLRFVIAPQAFRRILPSLAGQLISTIKDSAIVSVISIPELTFQGLEIMSATYLTFETWITITALYFLLTFACSLGVRHLENALRPG